MRQRTTFLSTLSLGIFALGISQAGAETLPLNEETWDYLGNVEAVEFKGKEALLLENGLISLKDRTFKNGIISFEMSFPAIRGFTGVYFRAQDAANAEHLYFRPHQSGNEDANQYQPVFNDLAGWQIYFGPQYSTGMDYNFSEWMQVKVLVKDDRAEFYIDSDEPFLHVDDLLQVNEAGGIAFGSGLVATHFANIEVIETDDITFKGEPVAHAEWPENVITSFNVAEAAVLLSDVPATGWLNHDMLADKTWVSLPVERNGIANLARVNTRPEVDTGEVDEEGNPVTVRAATALVRMTVTSDQDQIKVLNYGYSDKAQVYLNGAPVAGGDNTYQSRDYRYLGTVGLFDAVYLPLKAGENEVVFAVTEAFGGWGLMAAFEDMTGLSVE